MSDLWDNAQVKKVCISILAVFYFFSSIGLTFHKHYCRGELVGTSLFDFSNKECGKCGMKKHTEASKYCCKDVSFLIKPSDSHIFSPIAYDFTLSVFNAIPVFSDAIDLNNITKENIEINSWAHSPPLLKNSLFIKFRNFRIWFWPTQYCCGTLHRDLEENFRNTTIAFKQSELNFIHQNKNVWKS